MRVQTPNEGVQAAVRGVDVAGLGIGWAERQAYMTIGWHRTQSTEVIATDTAIRIEWPQSDPFSVRVGTEFPEALSADNRQCKEK